MAVVMFSSFFSPSISLANKSITDIKDERKQLKIELSKAEKKATKIIKEIEELDNEIKVLNDSYRKNKQAIKEVKEEVEEVNSEIEVLEDNIQERFSILTERARSYQQAGGNISFLEVVLGSKSFSDFISRVSAINQITQSDAAIIEEQQKEQEKVNEKLKELEELDEELSQMQGLIEEQKKTTNEMKKKQKEEEKKLKSEIAKLKKEDEQLANKIKSLTSKPAKPTNSGTNNIKVHNNSGGILGWPTVGGYISSPFGQRWGRPHNGIDIARTDRSVKPPILAAESGVVETAEFQSNGYGKVVVINHGNGLKTKYAHLDSISVSTGQSVERGQQIGIMGQTGNSTGIHLHIEVYENGSLRNPASYLQ